MELDTRDSRLSDLVASLDGKDADRVLHQLVAVLNQENSQLKQRAARRQQRLSQTRNFIGHKMSAVAASSGALVAGGSAADR